MLLDWASAVAGHHMMRSTEAIVEDQCHGMILSVVTAPSLIPFANYLYLVVSDGGTGS